MTPFYTRFPDLAPRETRCIHVLAPGDVLPVGEYGFIELYCEDPGCDCRRVLLQVTPERAPQTVLATINFGWESAEFYTRWMHGDAQTGREITDASLDPLNPQSKYADHLLDFFRKHMMTDSAYVARLARHYEMFKDTQRIPARPKPRSAPAPAAQPAAASMSTADILRQLQRVPDHAAFAPCKAALLAAIEQREATTPALIAAIDQASAKPAHYKNDPEDCLYLFAIYLLAQFRETRAVEVFLRFFSLPGEQALDLTGDLVTENGAAVLASVCGGDPAPLLRLVHNEAVNQFVRTEAIRALAIQALWNERPREAVVEDLRQLFHTLSKPGDGFVWAELALLVCDFHAPELAQEARRAFAEELVAESVIDLEGFEQELRTHSGGFEELRERCTPIDAVSECSGWVCFRDEEAEAAEWDDADETDDEFIEPAFDYAPPEFAVPSKPIEEYVTPPQPTPYIAPPKVGRNEPCPCGSAKKYKKCCGK